MDGPATIALFIPNWIGDAVMATPAIEALRDRFPNSRMIGVLRPYVADVFSGSPWFDEFIPLPSKSMAAAPTIQALRRIKPDVAVLFTNSFRTALIAWMGGCQRRIGYSLHRRSWLLTDRLPVERNTDNKPKPSPVLDSYNRLARVAGADPKLKLKLFTTPDDEANAEHVRAALRLESNRELIVLNPGAAFGAAKLWPADHFISFAKRLTVERHSQVLVNCGPADRELARRIAQEAGVLSLADQQLSIGLTKAIIRRCSLLVTTDSGPRHIATAFDRPVVTLFGPTHIAWTETYHARSIHLQKKVDCGPCQLRVCPLDHECMKTLTPNEVFDAVAQLLDRKPREVRHAG